MLMVRVLRTIVHGASAVLVNELIDKIKTNPVEHDGGNDFVDVEVGLEEAGDRTPDAARMVAAIRQTNHGSLSMMAQYRAP